MRLNIGSFDRSLRVGFAAVIIVVLALQHRTGAALLLWLVVAAALLGTGTAGFCPLYGLLGISTHRALPP